MGWRRGGEGGGRKVPAAYNSKTINDNEIKFGEVVKDHLVINLVWFNWRMTSSLHHNDVITVKILSHIYSFTKILPIKEEKFRDVSELKKRQINGTKQNENFCFNINDSILKKLSITKRVFSAAENSVYKRNKNLARKL